MSLITVYEAREGEFGPYTKCIIPSEAKEHFINDFGFYPTQKEAEDAFLNRSDDDDTDDTDDDDDTDEE